jgi:hypothetical protein
MPTDRRLQRVCGVAASAEPTNEPAQGEEQQPQPEEEADKTLAAAEADEVVAPAEEASTTESQPTPAAE